MGGPPEWGWMGSVSPTPCKTLRFIKWSFSLYRDICVFRMHFNRNKIFAADSLTEMSLNELK